MNRFPELFKVNNKKIQFARKQLKELVVLGEQSLMTYEDI